MKKIATLAVLAALVTTASAASITWGFGGQVYVTESKDSTAVLASTYSGDMPWMLALIYVGQNTTSFSLDSITTDSVVDTLSYAVTTSGKGSSVGKWNPASKTTATTAFENGASFAVVLYDGTSAFDYIYSGTTAVGSAVTEATTISDMSQQGSGALFGTGGDGTSSGVVVAAVPEPGVAAMALLGIGMMIRRRRA